MTVKDDRKPTEISADETLDENAQLPSATRADPLGVALDLEGKRLPGAAALPKLRSAMLKAVRDEDYLTLQALLPEYQTSLEAAAVPAKNLTPDRLLRMETEHARFHEQLRATLMTTRISLRLELERVKASRQYQSDVTTTQAVDVSG